MSRGERAFRWLASTRLLPERTICRSCLQSRRVRYSSGLAIAGDASGRLEPDASPAASPASSIALAQPYIIRGGVVLSRPPLLTRDLSPFEKAYFFYQRRLNERLVLPFTRYFYYQRDTPAEIDWKKKIRERLSPTRDIGKYSAFGKESWHDEVLVGSKESEPAEQVEALLRDAVVEAKTDETGAQVKGEEEEIERPLPRETKADREGDTRSLNRALTRTLYFLVRGEHGWTFPHSTLLQDESLLRAAERILVQVGGINMNTWIVGHAPVGFRLDKFRPAKVLNEKTSLEGPEGAKTFFMKARIMAGQASLAKSQLGFQDFKWLTKDEICKEVHPSYWKDVKNMLVER